MVRDPRHLLRNIPGRARSAHRKKSSGRIRHPINLSAQIATLYWMGNLRALVVWQGIVRREDRLNSPPPAKRMHPMSDKPSFAPIRYRRKMSPSEPLHTVIQHQSPGKKPVRFQPEGGVLEEHTGAHGSPIFVTPSRQHTYGTSPSIVVQTPKGHRDEVLAVAPKESLCSGVGTSRKLCFSFGAEPEYQTVEVTIPLAYQQLVSPKPGDPMNNRRANGGLSADERMQQLLEGTVDDDVERMQLLKELPHHEYLHHIARHWGVVLEKSGRVRDPAHKENMFVGTAAFNTAMLLFERFADFLLFINHHRYKVPTAEPSIEYTVRIKQDPRTYDIAHAEVSIKDLRTQIEFTQYWDQPNHIQDKPYEETFITWLKLLKQAWSRTLPEGLKEVPRRHWYEGRPAIAIEAHGLPPRSAGITA